MMHQVDYPTPFLIEEGEQKKLSMDPRVLNNDDLVRVLLDQSKSNRHNASKKKCSTHHS